MKRDFKTNLVAVIKVLLAVLYLVYKMANGKMIGEEDMAIVSLAIGGALGNFVSADARAPGVLTRASDEPRDPPVAPKS